MSEKKIDDKKFGQKIGLKKFWPKKIGAKKNWVKKI